MEGMSGAILCGGRSSRMGQDKSKLLLAGKTLLEHQIEKLQSLGINDIMLSGQVEALHNARTVTDVYPNRGPLGGIHACLQAAKHPVCFVVAVDMPLLPVAALQKLAASHRMGAGQVTAFLIHGQIQPLAAVYDTSLAAIIEPLIRDESVAVRTLLAQVKVEPLIYDGSEQWILNCNTPEDYHQLLNAAEQPGLHF